MKNLDPDFVEHSIKVKINLNYKKKLIIRSKSNFFVFNFVFKTFFIRFLKQILKFQFYSIKRIEFKKYLFVFVTNNQFLALKPLFLKLIDESSCYYNKFQIAERIEEGNQVPYLNIYFKAMINLFKYWNSLNKVYSDNFERKIEKHKYFYHVIYALSTFQVFNKIFHYNKPKYLVMSNDHLDLNVGVLYSAKRYGISTFYFQHANISELFPRMNFDYAFLYSKKAAEKYEEIGKSETIFFCIGNMKVDEFIGINSERIFDPDNLIVSLCVNSPSELKSYIDVANKLAELEKVKTLKFRLHPSLSTIKLQFLSSKISISNPYEEASFDFFKGVNLNIAGNSSIVEEAIFVDVPTIFFHLDEKLNDYYGYLKEDAVIISLNNTDSIVQFVLNYNQHFPIFEKSNNYSSSIGTIHEGKTTDLIYQIIKSIESNSLLEFSTVKRDLNFCQNKVFII